MNKKKTRTKAKKTPATIIDPLQAVYDKFARLKELRKQIADAKRLYSEYDELCRQLLPQFVTVESGKFVIHREVTIGRKTYRLSAGFFDEKKGEVTAKQWKSTAMENFFIE